MRVLELRLQKLHEQLAEFDKKYTRNYLALNPSLNVLPKQIEDLKREIQSKRNFGQNIALSDAQQDYNAARQSLAVIKRQLNDHKRQATEFSSKFAEHEALLTDLEGLEKLQRTTEERLVQIEAKQAEKFPQVKIIERAFHPHKPFSPNYTQNAIIAIIAIVGSIVLGLFCVWAVEYLTRKDRRAMLPHNILGLLSPTFIRLRSEWEMPWSPCVRLNYAQNPAPLKLPQMAGRLFGMQVLPPSRATSALRISELPCRLLGTKNHHSA